jgi:hypothetical protein
MSLLICDHAGRYVACDNCEHAESHAKSIHCLDFGCLVNTGRVDRDGEPILENIEVACVPVDSLKAEAVTEDSPIWLPIEGCPRESKEMFVAIAIDVRVGTTKYTSDPYCVWHAQGKFERWPHGFQPTHYMPLPNAKG